MIDNVHQRASVPFWQSFGLDFQNTRAELEFALSGTSLSASPIQDALNAALQNVLNLTAKLSSGAAARIAAFSLIPQGEIGGYTGLERFLNEVRVVLGLPTAQAASARQPQPRIIPIRISKESSSISGVLAIISTALFRR